MSIASTYTADLSKNRPKIDIFGKRVDKFDMNQKCVDFLQLFRHI